MSDYKDENGEWRHGTSGERLNVQDYQGGPANYNSGGGGNEKAMGDMGAKALAGGAGIGIVLALIVPSILVVIIEKIFCSLFKAKIIGKVFQSAIFGLLSCAVIAGAFSAVASILKINSNILLYVVGFAGYAAGALWYYFSHYYSLKAALHDERFEIYSTLLAGLFVDSFGIMFYGYIVAFIVSAFVKIAPVVIILFLAPLIAGIILYIKRVLSVSNGASVIKGEESSQPIGALAALALIPLFLLIAKITNIVAAFVIIIGVPVVYGIVISIKNKSEQKRQRKSA